MGTADPDATAPEPAGPETTSWFAVPLSRWTDTDGAEPRRRSATTRHALVLAAARRFDASGYDAAALSDILAESGRTKGALYFHFASKRALAEALVEEVTRSWHDVVERIADRRLDALSVLLVETDAYVARWSHDPLVRGASRALTEGETLADLRRSWFGTWEESTCEYFLRAHAEGLLRPEADPERASRVLVAASTGHHVLAESDPDGFDFWDRMTDMWQALLPVIATDEWLTRWRASGWETRPGPRPEDYRLAREP